ncbi:pyrroline-5-carboxylate reductase [Flavihumibacter sp. CACIAM 22H1]|uniref:pyrroline-5-carboxylate reductase n=1 Tax=Flavihumibacter sp. CACIAM 22H1 TaxID=1812911 RepID=UPI0007A7C738|nr:pyrroline-5-carboxylate reductase [Flavihumibacter sp. CACIAM 22H1]KYP16060.1 MAG: pyrroline-5-carboxylate reductase [Flavihumibacter sp. CACIAM 22H1]
MSKTIAIIGGGNLGISIAEGLTAGGFLSPSQITVTRRTTTLLQPLQQKGMQITSDNLAAAAGSEVILLAVKPFQIKEVIREIAPALTSDKLLISVVTGVSMQEMRSEIGIANSPALFRAMPNTAVAIRESMTCISHSGASQAQVEWVLELFNQVGRVVAIDEKLMDAATVLGACGTAYAMRYIRANIQGGIEIGFDAKTASLIAAQTVKGAAELLLQKGTHPEYEIDKVTTPKGCTIAGLNEMEHQGFSSSLIKGISASYVKIQADK